MIPYGRQDISDADIAAVLETLQSDYLTQGQRIVEFESKLAQICQSEGAVAVTNATSALHLGCLALNIGQGDLVWTSPVSFVASANVALYCGAEVDFVDIQADTGLMCPHSLKRKLETAEANGRLPKLIIPVHLAGQSCDMEAIHKLAAPYGIALLEDASHAIGARYQDRPVGSCEFSDACVFSFHPVKIITTGEGGAITSNNTELLKAVTSLRSHGITREETLFTEPTHGQWYYQQLALGFNYRMTEIQAALGSSQLSRLKEFVNRRCELAAQYDHLFSEHSFVQRGITPLQTGEPHKSSWHLYIIRCNEAIRNPLFSYLRDHQVLVNVHYIPIHLQPYYQHLGFERGDYPLAETYYRQAISLPLYPGLSDAQQMQIVELIEQFLQGQSL